MIEEDGEYEICRNQPKPQMPPQTWSKGTKHGTTLFFKHRGSDILIKKIFPIVDILIMPLNQLVPIILRGDIAGSWWHFIVSLPLTQDGRMPVMNQHIAETLLIFGLLVSREIEWTHLQTELIWGTSVWMAPLFERSKTCLQNSVSGSASSHFSTPDLC